MKAAAQAYRLRRQIHAYGIGARNHFRSPTHVFLREPELLRMNDNNQSDDVIHLRYQHHARTPRASVSQDPSNLRRYPDQISAARPQVLTSLGKASDMVRASNRTEWHLPTSASWEVIAPTNLDQLCGLCFVGVRAGSPQAPGGRDIRHVLQGSRQRGRLV